MKRYAFFTLTLLLACSLWGKAQTNPKYNTLKDTSTVSIPGVEIKGMSLHSNARPVSVLTPLTLSLLPTSDPGMALREIPNVNGVRKGPVTLDPVVRGFRSAQLNVQLNGGLLIEGGCPNRMDPVSSHVATDQLQSIQVLKGPYALRYGPNMGGVVRILTRKPQFSNNPGFTIQARKRMETNWPGDNESVGIGYSAEKIATSLYAGRTKYGDYLSGGGEVVSSAFNKYHYGGAVALRNSNKHSLVISADGSHGYNVHYPALPMDERSDDTYYGLMEYSFTPEKGMMESLDLSLWHSRVHHVMDNKERSFSDTVAAVSDLNTTAQGYRLEALISPQKFNCYIGSDGSYITKTGQRFKNMIMQPPNNGSIPVKIENLWNDAHILNLGIFTEVSRNYDKWFWVLSGRIDFNQAASNDINVVRPGVATQYSVLAADTKSDYINWSASVGVTRTFENNFSAGLSFGRAMRSPDMTERFIIMLPVGYDKYDYLGNPALLPETNYEADLTLKKQWPQVGVLSAGVFVSMVSNYITAVRIPENPLSTDVLGVKQFVNGDNALLRGFEVSFMNNPKQRIGITYNAAITYGTISNVEKTLISEYGQVTGTTIIETDALPEIPPFETNITLSLRNTLKQIEPFISLRYVAAQNHISEAYYEQESPGFLLANMHIRYTPVSWLKITGGVKNLLDTDYYEHLNRRVIGTTTDLPEPGRVWYVQLIIDWK